MNAGLSSSIDAAVRRRDSIIASQTAVPPSAPQPSPTSGPLNTPLIQDTQTSSTSFSASSSAQIAQTVLSGQGSVSSAGPSANTNTDMTKLAAALNGGLGGPSTPIAVTINEREYVLNSLSCVT